MIKTNLSHTVFLDLTSFVTYSYPWFVNNFEWNYIILVWAIVNIQYIFIYFLDKEGDKDELLPLQIWNENGEPSAYKLKTSGGFRCSIWDRQVWNKCRSVFLSGSIKNHFALIVATISLTCTLPAMIVFICVSIFMAFTMLYDFFLCSSIGLEFELCDTMNPKMYWKWVCAAHLSNDAYAMWKFIWLKPLKIKGIKNYHRI